MGKFARIEPINKFIELERIHTEEGRFYKAPSGMFLPSVTTVLGHFKNDSIKKWQDRVGMEEAEKIKNIASVNGSAFHTIVENYLNNQTEVTKGFPFTLKEQFLSLKRYLDKIDFIRYTETAMHSEILGVAGTVDCVAEYLNMESIIDFKTSLRPKKPEYIQNYFEQATAYAIMYEHMTGKAIEQIVIMIAVEDAPAQCFVENKSKFTDTLYEKIELYQKYINQKGLSYVS